ncbi:hypothetical protein COY61_01680 [bacterium (Candidatus Gribaldobacteria) CG_4_10_14_0_8_um_filter_33_9]|uniref:Uncharacterized protein n=1 Tax=bacterium (Candidatus Gribaldobacteria) CG_4_10_14_0_8_um_filter_33_9 TaxID=2014266 RepID=A0A2M7RMQ3_9BACT|nr:MAG: hypothetical protein COY61_01680 [bacterium (Candidatus Gribaldobacteria) CG_4_10_14_0_8_um_filter_33_9]
MKRLALIAEIVGIAIIGFAPLSFGGVLGGTTGMGVYFQSSPYENVSVSGISAKHWFRSGTGIQVIYNNNHNKYAYNDSYSNSSGSREISSLKIRVLRKSSVAYIGGGYVRERHKNEYEYTYSNPPSPGLGSLARGGGCYSGFGSAKLNKIQALIGTEYCPIEWVGFSGELGINYTYSLERKNAYVPEDKSVFAEVGVHLYF